jgi:hypothetical protein
VLRDAITNGNQIGVSLTNAPVAASNGLFTVTLDFGGAAFVGNATWLEIGVRTNGSTAPYTILSPPQALMPVPNAIFALNTPASVNNTASGSYAAVGGGYGNIATANYSTVAGGIQNSATNIYATVGGGIENNATGGFSIVAGGAFNTGSGNGAFIGGGLGNNAVGVLSTMAGGDGNSATNLYATVGGGHSPWRRKQSGLGRLQSGGGESRQSQSQRHVCLG